MLRKGNLAVLKVAISPKPERSRPPKLVCMHMTSIPTCMNAFHRLLSQLLEEEEEEGREGRGLVLVVLFISCLFLVGASGLLEDSLESGLLFNFNFNF